MQFKYPELLWALLLLLIPIFIHLFQLRRFKKTPFTNVKMLQRVQAESRRSHTLKKWLLLLTRLGLLAALVFAFAQPFSAGTSALKEKEMVIYLDDSYSMQAKLNNVSLLENAIQDLIKSIPDSDRFSLFTNEKVFKNVQVQDIKNELLSLGYTSKQLKLNEVQLKSNTLFSANETTEKNLILISDFQQRLMATPSDTAQHDNRHFVQLSAGTFENIAIDSVFISETAVENMELTCLLTSRNSIETTAVSLFNGNKLIAKTSATFNKNHKAEVHFTLPIKEPINGRIAVADEGLSYDNLLHFNIDDKKKIKVLSIDGKEGNYLRRIFNNDEFDFLNSTLTNLNYGLVEDQNLIVLNELETLPNSLYPILKSFTDKGGSLVVIPSDKIDFTTYNMLTMNYRSTAFTQRVNIERNITNIAFSHPLYANVFEKNVTNFQYPQVSQYYRITTTAPKILSFQDDDAFLVGSNGFYLFTASLSAKNSNFKNSPLIVPTFYQMGANSLKIPQLYQTIGTTSKIDIPYQLSTDDIVKVANENHEFIPQQRSLANKVSLSFFENDMADGIYEIRTKDEVRLQNISFNYPREESDLTYIDINQLDSTSKQGSVVSLFQQMRNDNAINELWKWFVILALLFLTLEILVQKFLK